MIREIPGADNVVNHFNEFVKMRKPLRVLKNGLLYLLLENNHFGHRGSSQLISYCNDNPCEREPWLNLGRLWQMWRVVVQYQMYFGNEVDRIPEKSKIDLKGRKTPH